MLNLNNRGWGLSVLLSFIVIFLLNFIDNFYVKCYIINVDWFWDLFTNLNFINKNDTPGCVLGRR